MQYHTTLRRNRPIIRSVFIVFAAISALASLQSLAAADKTPYRLFPNLYRKDAVLSLPATVSGPSGRSDDLRIRIPILAGNTIVAFYGHPSSARMGILGEYSKEDLATLLDAYAKMFDRANGRDGVVPAYYLIYGTCWPGGEIGYLKDSILEDYIRYAASRGMLVFVDHQIGKYSVRESMERILPFLKYPNVHLALDPEWRTLKPMQEIGSITAAELNEAQRLMDNYIRDNGIPGVRILVVHQFQQQMIKNRQEVRADFDRVLLVHTADGFGSPAVKLNSYRLNAQAENMPVKGFKLFFKSVFPLAGYDDPLLTPEEVMALDPRPGLIIYQ
ncbi:MAG: hypothetical protein WAZ99_08280 [Rectinemataceae bacterium]